MSTLQPPPESSFSTSEGKTPNFDCVVGRRGRDAVWIRLAGELDLLSTPQLKRTLHEATTNQRMVVVDMRGLSFMDSTGIHAVLDADTRARRAGARLVLIRGSGQVGRLFELVGIADRLEIVDLRS